MDNIPYQEWAEYVRKLLIKRGIRDGLVLELGCGTGAFTELFAAFGYDMIGVDSSAEMLERAVEKKEQSGADILYLLQDMREFELYGTVRAVVSICDSINYIVNSRELVKVFSLVNNYLDPGGVFIFDLKTPFYFEQVVGDQVIAEHRSKGSLIWENLYYEEEQVNEYDLTMFLKRADGLYEKYTETHLQRAYEIKKIRELLEEAGLKFEAAFDAFTENQPHDMSERVYIVAREYKKQEKYVSEVTI
ncbi:MAG: class I SAM-dependent methyltransferase [Eubacteriales bacterium]|nr:class I SAM-dependent methyltransferase [Eubacteriales bacterium]